MAVSWPLIVLRNWLGLFCLLFGGFKGQVRWPKGPPHLAANPPYFFVLFSFCFCFFFVFRRETVFFPPKKAVLLFFSVSLCFSLAPSPFSLSLSLSLSLDIFFLSSLLSLFLGFFCCLAFVSLFLCFCFLQRTTSKCQIWKNIINPFRFWLVSCLVLSFKSLSLIFVFVILLSCVFVNIHVYLSRRQLIKNQLWVKLGVATKRFFYNLCFAKCENYHFFGPFVGKFWLMLKNIVNIVFLHSLKSKRQILLFLGVIIWAKIIISTIWASDFFQENVESPIL